MYNWPLNDAHFVLLVQACLAVITIGSIVTALTKVRRAEFARLQYEVEQHSQKIKALEMVEQRRFLMDLKESESKIKSKSNGAERPRASVVDPKLVDDGRSAGVVA